MKKKKKKKKELKIFRLNLFIRQWGMLEKYKSLTPSLVKYYITEIKNMYVQKPYRVKIYIEDLAGYTKEELLGIIATAGVPMNIKFIWGRRKPGWEKHIRVKQRAKSK